MKFLKKYFPLLGLLSVSAVYFFGFLGRDLLTDWDECIYAAYTHSMKISGDFLAHQFNGQVVFDKPPLYMWLLGLSTTFGENEFSFRVLSAIAGLSLITVVYLFTQKYFSRKVAVISALLLLTSPSIVSHARIINTDIFFTLFIFVASWSWLESYKRERFSYLAGLLFGLGVMVKGLGSLQFSGVILVCAIFDMKRDSLIRFLKVLAGFLATILPWHILAFMLYRNDFLNVYIYDNIIKRSLYAIENHRERWFFYFRLLIAEFFPWIVFLAVAPFSIFLRINKVKSLQTFKYAWAQSRILFTLILLFALPLLSMTRVATKLSWYAMPILPFLAIILAYYITVFIKRLAATIMQGPVGSSLINVIFAFIVLLISIDAFTTLSKHTRLAHPSRQITPRNEAILQTRKYNDKELDYLVPFGERQGRAVLPETEQIAQTWFYGGNACAVYYSQKYVYYHYHPEEFVKKMTKEPGVYLVENGDLHFLKDIKNKKKVFENIEYTIFRQ